MDDLNPEQHRAATHGAGPLLIIAGAGTGKTKTLAHRVAHLVSEGTPPERILLLTFTRRAAQEMLRRAGDLTGETQSRRVWGGTFHAVANRLLRTYGRAIGLPPEFTVMDQADTADLMNLIRDDLELGEGKRRFPRKDTLGEIYSRLINARETLSDVLEAVYPWCIEEVEGIRRLFQTYVQRKRQQGVLDYDDLLLYWHALTQAEMTRDLIASLFDHVLVDEYQDTNVAQLDILRAMRRHNRNLTVVGDDAQAIYSFRAATVRNILDFPQHFPGAEVVRLEQNYRSIPPILALTNVVMAQAYEGHAKTLWSSRSGQTRPSLFTCLDETQQAEIICRQVLDDRERGVALRQQAVLFRSSHHSDQLEVELVRRNIPFVKYGGLKFLEAAHVKDLLALLRILENPQDEMSWFRALQLIEGVGPRHARTLMTALGVLDHPADHAEPDAPRLERRRSPLSLLTSETLPVPSMAAGSFDAFRQALADCDGLTLGAQVERLRGFYDSALERLYENAEPRLRDLQQLEQMAGRYLSRQDFLTDLVLDPPSSTSDLAGPPLLDEDYLTLSTIHSAKGGEWATVHVIHAADGMIPSDMSTGSTEAVDEERRLFYVALTRARDRLNVYFPLRYYHRRNGRSDSYSYAQITRFLTSDARALMDHQVMYDASSEPSSSPPLAPAAPTVDQLLNDLLGG
ncbi:MAG: ATP-dependent helicase [Chloroflexi bacterium]|nr:ATP-dependent helicase [Chloroflexota bacterium]